MSIFDGYAALPILPEAEAVPTVIKVENVFNVRKKTAENMSRQKNYFFYSATYLRAANKRMSTNHRVFFVSPTFTHLHSKDNFSI